MKQKSTNATKYLALLLGLSLALLMFFGISCSSSSGDSHSRGDDTLSLEVTPGSEEITNFQELLIKAESGSVEAQLALAKAYDRGEGLPQDPKSAVRWWRMAADQGSLAAIRELVSNWGLTPYCYYYDRDDIIRWLREGAEQGDAICCARYGSELASDEWHLDREKQDFTAAIMWLKKAGREGLFHLGLCYDWLENYEDAFKCFYEEAEKGEYLAMEYLAEYYQEGKYVDRDLEKASYWRNRAKEKKAQDRRSTAETAVPTH